ncbi:response regulator transcription factor [Spongiivirga sp. MCCC 1A20706]|uniref:response regulator n=1 Tax=Spongiivirga sp. MCCC 1A20706 TaxID=3160963 RepID=UPI003977650A
MIQIAIADDHQLFREGLASMLDQHDEITIVGQVADGNEALQLLEVTKPDILLLDIEMPIVDGFSVLKAMKKGHLSTKVLVLTMHDSNTFIKNIVAAGAHGYLKKDTAKRTLIEAINQLANTGSYYPPETARLVFESLREKEDEKVVTPREKEVITLISEGLTTKEIAAKLFLSKHTVESHRQNILLKLDLNNSAELVKYAMKKGWG